MGRKITLELPEPCDLDEKELLMLLAAHLYGDGKMSMGRAAAIAGVSKRTLMENLGKYGVPVFNYSASDLEQDVKNAASHH